MMVNENSKSCGYVGFNNGGGNKKGPAPASGLTVLCFICSRSYHVIILASSPFGVGLGWIDSHSQIFGAQGQDFTFNILTAVGVSCKVNDRWKATASVLYQHLSNAAQTDPNPSLNLIGPQFGLTYSF